MATPNILLLIIDCLRADRAHGVGSARIPAITALRESGVSFPTTVSSASTTVPCVASILTGLYPFGHGARSLKGYVLHPGARTMAEYLRDAGYHTYAKLTGPLRPGIGLERGFEDFQCRPRRDYLDRAWGQNFLAAVANGELREPWLLVLHLFEVHRPRHVPPHFRTPAFGSNSYDRALSALDETLGDLFRLLPRDTVTVLTGDHGEKIQETLIDELWFRVRYKLKRRFNVQLGHDIWGHGYHVFEYLVRVPLFWSAPGLLPPGRTSAVLARHVDVLPTLLDLLDVSPSSPMHGASLLPTLDDVETPARTALLEAVGSLRRNDARSWLAGIRTDRFKYVFGAYSDDIPEELYDLVADPSERHNLAKQEPALAHQFRQLFEETRGDLEHEVPAETADYTDEEARVLTKRLQDLGYL